jgi:hypothetical protein
MTTITLKPNQAALILETSEEGDIEVEVAYAEESIEENGFAAGICEVLAQKLVDDEKFQEELLAALDAEMDAEGCDSEE